MLNPEVGGEEQSSPPFRFDFTRAICTPEMARHAISEALKRGLPEVKACKAHNLRMAIVAGGPSVEDTVGEIKGYIAAVNKAHDWLIEKGIVPQACGLLDPVPWMAHYVHPHKDVTYFVASQCHGLLFDKLKGHKVVLWHAGQGEQIRVEDIVPPGTVLIPGGTSMAMRWLDLGYFLGFRAFDFHGFDSSHRKGGKHHAYEFRQDDDLPTQEIDGYVTWPGWLMQINDFFLRMERFTRDEAMDPIEVRLHGDGLLQHLWKQKTGSLVYRTKS